MSEPITKDEQPTQPTKTYLEAFANGKWETVETFPADDARALRALIKHRELNPQARVRITNDQARVLLDVPPVGAS